MDGRVNGVTKVSLVPEEKMELMAQLENAERKELWVLQVFMDLLVTPDSRVMKEKEGQSDQLDLKDQEAHQDLTDHLAELAQKV